MKSPLELDNATVKEFNIVNDLDFDGKLGFARSMQLEMQKIVWRNRMDLLTSQILAEEAPDEPTREAHEAKVKEYRNSVKQMARTVDIYTQLVEDLETTQAEE